MSLWTCFSCNPVPLSKVCFPESWLQVNTAQKWKKMYCNGRPLEMHHLVFKRSAQILITNSKIRITWNHFINVLCFLYRYKVIYTNNPYLIFISHPCVACQILTMQLYSTLTYKNISISLLTVTPPLHILWFMYLKRKWS